MSTKTMRPPSRRVPWANSTSTGSANSSGSTGSHKRKDRDDGLQRPQKRFTPTPPVTKLPKPVKPIPGSEPIISHSKGSKPISCNSNNSEDSKPKSNQLLAGYLAHEFLTKGTLLGKRWDPQNSASRRVEPKQEVEPEEKYERYVKLAGLLKSNGTHMSGVVNPTQLAHFLQLL